MPPVQEADSNNLGICFLDFSTKKLNAKCTP